MRQQILASYQDSLGFIECDSLAKCMTTRADTEHTRLGSESPSRSHHHPCLPPCVSSEVKATYINSHTWPTPLLRWELHKEASLLSLHGDIRSLTYWAYTETRSLAYWAYMETRSLAYWAYMETRSLTYWAYTETRSLTYWAHMETRSLTY